MCTAVTYKTKDFYFGRTLDYEFSYGEKVTIVPRKFPLKFLNKKSLISHYALIGMAFIQDDYPLFYEASNEKGLAMAGLNFVGNAFYNSKKQKNKDNIAQFEFIPWILAQCKNVDEAIKLINKMNLMDTPFSSSIPVAQLHWIIADKKRAITVEATKDGLFIYENEVGVLTNNPPFPYQMFNLNNYINVSNGETKNEFGGNYKLEKYSRGMGGIGLPGDLSSQSRFVRAAFVKLNSLSTEKEEDSVSQFFHILGSVDQQNGCCKLSENVYEKTIYTSCINVTKGIYYYTSYNNHQINGVNINSVDLNNDKLYSYELNLKENINYQN